ncbi:unnamed protein product [Lepeophtheirus salmonis]|uniref:(salmon louse) hypothetical protein n=1 Tax=Lepeophtheirus salmonis TaxID=72036 RepID=A0A7R8H8M7_LEPSM|nr:unnamed protein product [Lepeophtheirus salmonis]CAF2925533.1 unnamed protein product [Lepeophtheirus salmonis]
MSLLKNRARYPESCQLAFIVMITLLRVSKTIIRRLSSNSAEKIESIAGSLYKGQLSTRILSYPVSDAHTDTGVSITLWKTPDYGKKLNSHCKIHDDHSLFLSGFVGPRPVSLSGQNTPLGEWAHCKSAAQNRRNALTYKEMEDDKMLITGIENFDATNDLEDYILDFRFLLDASLLTHGRNIQLEEEELSRMAEYASELLAIISIISRLNLLSTTPGGYKKDYEKCLGYSYMRDAFIRLKFLKERLGKESHTNNDKKLTRRW